MKHLLTLAIPAMMSFSANAGNKIYTCFVYSNGHDGVTIMERFAPAQIEPHFVAVAGAASVQGYPAIATGTRTEQDGLVTATQLIETFHPTSPQNPYGYAAHTVVHLDNESGRGEFVRTYIPSNYEASGPMQMFDCKIQDSAQGAIVVNINDAKQSFALPAMSVKLLK